MRSDAIDPASLDVPHGIATRGEWLAAGASDRMFTDGRLAAVGSPYFALPELVEDPRQLVRLLGALAPAESVVTGWAAALLHGVRDAGPTMLRANGAAIQLALARGDHRCPPAFDTLRVSLTERDVTSIDGILVTTPARTAYDMARFSTHVTTAVAVLDAFCFELNPSPVTANDLGSLIQRSPRGRGHPLLRRALALCSSRSRSIPESRLRVRLRTTFGLSASDVAINPTLDLPGRSWELDLLDWTTGLILEYDSRHHTSTAQRERDARKDLETREAGLRVLRVNSTTLSAPDAVFMDYVRRGQRDAQQAGAAQAAAALRAQDRLAERPLARYQSAVGSPTLSAR